ncbi:tyrosine-type recombinase/integrase [Leekyejoonella antrihumi]|uniref:tyrosine-type recombinase/integrase n=1 Tax=Leekyejoonella antrihumi TaxID=1660198 RepID=UPI001FE8DAA1|nr:site-specific integrase [Leekyejoonella antrihumi]
MRQPEQPEAAAVHPPARRAGGNHSGRRRSFGTLRRLPSRRYQAGYLGPDGRRHVAPTTFQTKGDAEAWLSLQLAAMTEGRWRPAPSSPAPCPTFGVYARQWLTGRELKPRTRAEYARMIVTLIDVFGDTPLDAITAEQVRSWHVAMGPAHPTARAHTYSLLRTILNTAVEEEVLSSNPCRIRGAGRPPGRHGMRPATLEELTQIAQAMPDRYRLMVHLAAWCALRFGELTELRRKDIDLRQQVIRVRRGVTWPGGQAQVGTPKSTASIRDVSIPPHLMPAIRHHLASYAQSGSDGLLFPNTDGHHMHHGSLYKVYRPARAAAGRPDLRWHDLRHTGATLAAHAGATTRELMDRLGHSTSTMAMRYQHIADDRPAEIARRLTALAEQPNEPAIQ